MVWIIPECPLMPVRNSLACRDESGLWFYWPKNIYVTCLFCVWLGHHVSLYTTWVTFLLLCERESKKPGRKKKRNRWGESREASVHDYWRGYLCRAAFCLQHNIMSNSIAILLECIGSIWMYVLEPLRRIDSLPARFTAHPISEPLTFCWIHA